MTNIYEAQYNKELNTYNFTNLTAFVTELFENNQAEDFVEAIEKENDIYFIAVDWSLPVVVVRYFKEQFKKALDI